MGRNRKFEFGERVVANSKALDDYQGREGTRENVSDQMVGSTLSERYMAVKSLVDRLVEKVKYLLPN